MNIKSVISVTISYLPPIPPPKPIPNQPPQPSHHLPSTTTPTHPHQTPINPSLNPSIPHQPHQPITNPSNPPSIPVNSHQSPQQCPHTMFINPHQPSTVPEIPNHLPPPTTVPTIMDPPHQLTPTPHQDTC